jgi:hypothetical protein
MTTLPTSKPKPQRAEINANYSGYLKPHVDQIQRLADEGKSPGEIGRILYAAGIRSPYDGGPNAHGHSIDHARTFAGLIAYMLRPRNAKEERRRRRIARARRAQRELEQRARVIDLAEYRTGAARPTNRSNLT